jgi:putative transposase
MKTKRRSHFRSQVRKSTPQRKRLTRREKIKKQVRRQRRLATIRRIPDDVWELIRPVLPPEKPAGTVGRPIVPYRTVLNGILYVLRTGCQWKMVSNEFGSGSTCHKRFQEWVARGVFLKAWQLLLRRYDELRGIQWLWQAVDSKSVPAPLGGEDTGPNPTDRGKSGSKRHQLVDGRGVPLSAEVTAANATDMKTNPAVLDGIVVKRPRPTHHNPQHLCEDKGYDYPECREQALARGYLPHIPHKGTDPSQVPTGEKRHPARRWVVERTHSWQNCLRKLRTRWEKKTENWEALWHFANCLTVYRMTILG